MIFEINQTRTSFRMEYVAQDIKTKTICIAKVPFQKIGLDIFFKFDDITNRMYFNNRDTTYGTSAEDRMKFRIFDSEDALIGESKMVPIKGHGFLQSYWRLELNLDGVKYTLYEVGFGHDGLYLCIYKEDKELVAIVDKQLRVIDFQDKYTVYSDSEEHSKYIMYLVLHYDITKYGDVGQRAMHSDKKKIVNTISKEAKAKYDPDFIPRIKAMHEAE